MHDHRAKPEQVAAPGETVILIGNPNVGKSVIFSWLTGRYVEVSNYPGTTVEITQGQMQLDGAALPVVDTPGINSLTPHSMDEQVTREILFSQHPRAVVQVADAKNLRRALLLNVQLTDMGLPMVLVLNMQDEAASRGIRIDTAALSRRLGIPVLPTVALRGEGLDALPQAIQQASVSHFKVSYDASIETAVTDIAALLPPETTGQRALSLAALLSEDIPAAFPLAAHSQIEGIREATAKLYEQPLIYAANQQRLRCVDCVVQTVSTARPAGVKTLGEKLGDLTTHPLWGWPILLLVLFALYQVVGVLGAGVLVDFFENTVFGQWLNPLAIRLVDGLLPIPLLHDFLVGEYGLVTMALSYGIAIVLPIVTTFFLVFSVLEDSGYLARLAVMANRPFKALGLNGKAVLPMVLGLGCDTMATMTTRIMETRKERLQVMLLLALGVPCSAQLGAILGMVTLASPRGMLLWAGVVMAVLLIVGWLASKVIPGKSSDFIVELPPMRLPRPSSILFKTLARLEWYMKEVLPLFILGTALLFVLDRIGGLAFLEQLASPLIQGVLGLPPQATAMFLLGFLRRDYGAAGLFALARVGMLDQTQVIVSLVVITLFVPCIANFLMIIKEFGWRTATAVTAFIIPFAFAVGGLLNAALHLLGVAF